MLINKGIVDPARIAVTGWSYGTLNWLSYVLHYLGGYMSLMAIGQRPDFFKVKKNLWCCIEVILAMHCWCSSDTLGGLW